MSGDCGRERELGIYRIDMNKIKSTVDGSIEMGVLKTHIKRVQEVISRILCKQTTLIANDSSLNDYPVGYKNV